MGSTRRQLGALFGVGAVVGATAGCSSPDRAAGSEVATAAADGAELLRYGKDPSQFAELTRPTGPSRGVVVVLHGGFWLAEYDLSLGRPLAQDLAARGWTALNVEYRRVGARGGVPSTLDDVSAAVDLLGPAGVDTPTVVALGHSAGGQLAVWAAGRRRPGRWASAAVGVTHAVAQAGVLDLRTAAEDDLGGGAVQAFLGGAPDERTDAYALADPVARVPLEIPVWCVHGRDDTTVPSAQSRAYVAAATAAGARAALVEVPGDHFALIDVSSDAWARTVQVLDGIAPARA